MRIPFNKPYLSGKETGYITDAVSSGQISGNGVYTKKCHNFFANTWGFQHVLLTTSCTDALEMAALLLDIKAGDEVIMPSYTFVSTALAFVRQGAHIIFADSRPDHPGMDEQSIDKLVTAKTKAIVVVHYAGVACDMDRIMGVAHKHHLYVVEDAAHCIDSHYHTKPLGSIGHLGCFSFHETKNIQCGEGGLLAINDAQFAKRAEIIWEKGTNRAEFFRGEVNKYGWVDIGSSFLPSDLNAAYLYAQLENYQSIQEKRKLIWKRYDDALKPLEKRGQLKLPEIPDYAENNGHMYYMLCNSLEERTALIDHLKKIGILAVFHYLPLHRSPYYHDKYSGPELANCDRYADCLIRLPLYYELSAGEQEEVVEAIIDFYTK
jgi:dTDP-4-amino-4,6-dideoxygalactose transaminase